jgi:hypothetical protein
MKPLLPAAALSLALSGCGWMPADQSRTTHSSGALCFKSGENGTLAVVVSFDTCLSSSCDRLLGTSCHLSESGGTITVAARADVEHDGHECTADCGIPTARCESPPLAAGTYTVTYGLDKGKVTLPTAQAVLFSDSAQSVTCP